MADSLGVPSTTASITSPWERRLAAEWSLLLELAERNPGRLTDISRADATVRFRLLETPALALSSGSAVSHHTIRVEYRRFFPAVPLELYLEEPVLHPNIHPETGFICLWETHRSSNTIEHAIHKTVAILGWRLMNLDARHVMQPEAVASVRSLGAESLLAFAPLRGVVHEGNMFLMPQDPPRRRLS